MSLSNTYLRDSRLNVDTIVDTIGCIVEVRLFANLVNLLLIDSGRVGNHVL